MKKRLIATLMLFAMIAALVAACAQDDSAANGGAGANGGDAVPAVDDHLIVVARGLAVNMHPHEALDMNSAYLLNLVFDPLFRLNYATMEIEYALAESSEMSEDATSLNITLRPGVTFHNGDPVNAEVVRDSLYHTMNSPLVGFLISMVDNIEVNDELNLTINLAAPFAPIRRHLTHSGTAIIHPDTTNDNPIGTGAFIQESIVLDDRVELVANENWWGENAGINRITWRAMPEGTARLIEIETGGAHIAWDVNPSDLPRIEAHDNLNVHRSSSIETHFMAFQCEKAPFNDIRVRHAIAYALDIPLLSYTAYEGTGSPADSFLTPVVVYHHSIAPRAQNLDRARELMAEAGFADGFSTTLEFNSENQIYAQLAVMIASMLREINIDAEILQFEWGAYLDRVLAGEHELMLLSWNTITGDADYGLFDTHHSSGFPFGGNQSFYSNPATDALLEEGRSTLDSARRAEIYRLVQEQAFEAANILNIHHDERLHAAVASVRGFGVNPTGIIDLWNVFFG
ncbi:MAG: ABC transporter substrate-binding protein [Oscillospiraceae bacterium]|nr:ABC transporter substrate-binding protein [Oscillospiraceae bacterium]MCL2277879.1 ABC transporter substrate-binding protein [Oscillospiraceae bacterium]